ncbi:MAG TPA: sulfurtransferase TusA family protein [Acidiphilium sp.]|nr:sulfurtransferase TusA family protein [Acidiphilium sp.]HQU23727.1 sulfurtransferase TusA family protein [Acidiphilium sp.]
MNSIRSSKINDSSEIEARSSLPTHDRAIDITAETCPMTYVRTRLALDVMETGQILLVRLLGAEPLSNVPRAASDQGHDVLDRIDLDDGSSVLVIRKG